MFTYTKQLPIIARPDVLVCGAGLAGIGVAVAAARSGARTMVIERMGFAGGFFTAIIGSAFDGFVDERIVDTDSTKVNLILAVRL